MIRNSDLLFAKAKDFQNRRSDIVREYERNLQALERFAGSQGYEEELAGLKKKHEESLTALQEEYRPVFQTVLTGMTDNIDRRGITAPSADVVNLLNVLRMKKNVTLEDCQRTAEAVKDNALAISVVKEIAVDHGLPHDFDRFCSEMSSQTASEVVEGMKGKIEDFLLFDTTRASRIAAKYYEDHYGATDTQLTKRQLFSSKADCFSELAGLRNADELQQFCEIVDEGKGDD